MENLESDAELDALIASQKKSAVGGKRRTVVPRSERERKFKYHGRYQKFDLYRFARTILHYTRLQEDPHQAWCRELERHHRRSLWLEPRGTFKSTIFTKAHPIWRLVTNPNLRILIVNATAENAQAFLREIVGHYLRNPSLLEFYEENFGISPLDPNAAKKEYTVLNTRTKNLSEPSIATAGALDKLVSVHHDLIIVDDLCNIDDRESAAIREKKKRWYQDLVSVLEPRGELVIVGTHWHFDNLYSFIIKELNPQLPRGTSSISIVSPAIPVVANRGSPRFYPRMCSRHSVSRKGSSSSPVSISTNRFQPSTKSSNWRSCARSPSPRSTCSAPKPSHSATPHSASATFPRSSPCSSTITRGSSSTASLHACLTPN